MFLGLLAPIVMAEEITLNANGNLISDITGWVNKIFYRETPFGNETLIEMKLNLRSIENWDYIYSNRLNNKKDLELNSGNKRLIIKNLEPIEILNIFFDEISHNKINTPVVALDSLEFEEAEITLSKNGQEINSIWKCSRFNFTSDECNGDWKKTFINFVDNGDTITFKVNSFSGYGGSNLTILNVQSRPQVGGDWQVNFKTKGTNNLTIEASNGTNFGGDLNFVSLKCGGDLITDELTNGKIYVENWNCDNIVGHELSGILTGGKHNLKFTFGDDVAYAYNQATINESLVAYYKFNESTRGDDAVDSSGYGFSLLNSGDETTGVGFNDTGFCSGNAGEFDGAATSDFAFTISNAIDDERFIFQQASNHSVAFWVNTTDVDPIFMRFDVDADGFAYKLQLVSGGVPNMRCGAEIVATTNVSDGEWHHLVYARGGSAISIYVDGVVELNESSTCPDNAWDFSNSSFIGQQENDEQQFVGWMDELSFWNYTLSQQDVTNLYNGGVCLSLEDFNPPVITEAPQIESVGITPPTNIKANQSLNASAIVTDNDTLTGLSVRFTLYNGDNLLSIDSISSLANNTNITTQSETHEKDQVLHYLINATDGTNQGGNTNTTSVTVDNTNPMIASVGITPPLTFNNTNANVSINVQDIDNADSGSLRVNFTWFINNTINVFNESVASLSNNTNITSELSSSFFTIGDNITVMVSAFDGSELSSILNSSTIDVVNQLPIVNDLDFTPATILNTTDVNVSFVLNDDDSVSLTGAILFFVDQVLTQNTTITTLENNSNMTALFTATNYVKGENVTISAYIDDGLNVSAVSNTSFLVSNTNPTVPNITSREPLFTYNLTNNVNCDNSIDDDADSINYSFYVDVTSPPLLLNQSNSTNNMSYVGADNTYFVRCDAFDGENFSENTSILNWTVNTTFILSHLLFNTTPVIVGTNNTFGLEIVYSTISLSDVNFSMFHNNTAFEVLNQYSVDQTLSENENATGWNISLIAPIGAEGSSINFGWFGNGTHRNNSVISFNFSTFTYEINASTFESCTLSNATHEIIAHFPLKIEPNATNVTGKFEATMFFWLDDRNSNTTRTFELGDGGDEFNLSSFDICGAPLGQNWSSDAKINYFSDNFDPRQNYLANESLNNTFIFNRSLFLLPKADATSITFEVLNENDEGLVQHLIYVDRFDFATNTHVLVAMGLTDDDGKSTIFLRTIDAFYRFRIVDYIDVLRVTEDTQITSSDVEIRIAPDTIGETRGRFSIIQSSLTYDNDTKIITLVFNDPLGNLNAGCLKVAQYGLLEGQQDIVFDECVNNHSATITFTIPDNDTNYIATFHGTINPDNVFKTLGIFLTDLISGGLALSGVFLTFSIFLVMALIGIFHFAAAIIFGILGITFSAALGIITFGDATLPVIFGLWAIGLITIYRMAK